MIKIFAYILALSVRKILISSEVLLKYYYEVLLLLGHFTIQPIFIPSDNVTTFSASDFFKGVH